MVQRKCKRVPLATEPGVRYFVGGFRLIKRGIRDVIVDLGSGSAWGPPGRRLLGMAEIQREAG